MYHISYFYHILSCVTYSWVVPEAVNVCMFSGKKIQNMTNILTINEI